MGMLEGAAILLAGILAGRFLPARAKKVADSDGPLCGCKHGLSYHDPQTGRCKEQEYIDGTRQRFGYAKYRECTCRQYTGPEPLPTYYAPEIS